MGIHHQGLSLHNLGSRRFATVEDYAHDFTKFLEGLGDPILPSAEQDKYFGSLVLDLFRLIAAQVDSRVKELFRPNDSPTGEEIAKTVTETIGAFVSRYKRVPDVSSISAEHAAAFVDSRSQLIEDIREAVFEKRPIDNRAAEQLSLVCRFLLQKESVVQPWSGIVIAGFGMNEIFPSLTEFRVGGLYGGKLKLEHWKQYRVSTDEKCLILPFAQEDVAKTFLMGISPDLQMYVESEVSKLLRMIPGVIAQTLRDMGDIAQDKVEAYESALTDAVVPNYEQFCRGLGNRIEEQFFGPIKQAVCALSRDEIANLAESLVNLTSLKRRISMALDSVGGPIDVAVISKGDGLVWIKRKHYFDPSLNPAFVARYYKWDHKVITEGGSERS